MGHTNSNWLQAAAGGSWEQSIVVREKEKALESESVSSTLAAPWASQS